MSLSKSIPIALALTLLTPGVVIGDDDTGFYIGIAGNRLDANFDDVSDVSFDDSDTAASIKGGYMFNNYFGVEVGYLDLGDYEGDSGVTIDADSFQLAGVLNYDVTEKFDIYGKLGAFFVNAKSDQVLPIVGLVQEDDDTTEVYAAIGGELDLGALNFFAEYSVVDTDINDLTIDIISLGVKYEFGPWR